MRFIVSSSLLLKNLQTIGGVINSSNTLPILDNFLFNLDGNILTISASDLETTITATIDVISDSQGLIAIPAKMLIEILKTFAEMPITFTIDKELYSIEITTSEGRYKLVGQDGEDFPKIPNSPKDSFFEIDSSLLSKSINKTIFVTGLDENRPILMGVYFKISPDNFTVVATDSHRLVRFIRNDIHSDIEASFVLPKKPLNNLKNILAKEDTQVKIEWNSSNAFFTFSNIKLVCRLLDGRYPNYETVIVTDNPNKLIIDKSLFSNALKRISIFANQATYLMRLSVSGKELTVSAEDIDLANAASERMTCSYDGEDIEIGFNSKFLLEMLSNIDTNNVLLEMSYPNRAGLLFPIDGIPEESLLMLIMPIILNS
jgi:DNA polymerase-3 subunit beta